MINETKTIELISGIISKSKNQINKAFESDCEIIKLADKYLLFSIDGFSAEDQFRENDAYILGYNLAAATVSDVLACGGKPLYYLHSLVLSSLWNESYITDFTKGIRDVLAFYDIAFLGGDMGTSDQWQYTGTIVGESNTLLMRKGTQAGDSIYISGPIGAGNFEAVLNIYSENKMLAFALSGFKNKFPLRYPESRLIKQFASSCIDTSDGLNKSLHLLADINKLGFEITDIPYLKTALNAAKLLGKPKEMLMLGECGEYELLFTIPIKKEQAFLDESKKNKLEFFKLGTFTTRPERILTEGKKILDLKPFAISARDYPDVKNYISMLTNILENSWKTKE